MEKAVVRRGIGAVVLALVAALLLGYLLKGKKEDRQEIVSNDLPKAPIQIFPSKKIEGGGVTDAAGNVIAAGGVAATATADVASVGRNAKGKVGEEAEMLKDKVSGNPSVAANATGIDKAGQTVFGAGKNAASAGADVANASVDAAKKAVDFSTTAGQQAKVAVNNTAGQQAKVAVNNTAGSTGKRVRPSIESKNAVKLNLPEGKGGARQVAKSNTRQPKSTARLVGEKKLKPVRARRVVRSTRNAKNTNAISAAEQKQIAAASSQSTSGNKVAGAAVGRNKFTVQLLATSSANKAQSLRSTFKKEGYNAYVSNTSTGGKKLYRVRIGNFGGKSAASQKLTSLKRRYKKNKYVQSSMVVKF